MNDIDASFQKYALPKEYSSSEMFGNDEKFDPCQMYAINEEVNWKNSEAFGFCQSESFDNSTIMACESYVYDRSIFPETLTTSFDLVSTFQIRPNKIAPQIYFYLALKVEFPIEF